MAIYILTPSQLYGQGILNSFVVPAGSSVDPDAQAFITAAAITDATQQGAIDTLVTGLKTDGLWTKMKAIYPFVGGTASQHKYNLKDPRDLDAAFRIIFNGGWTHSSTGVLPNGTNAYADTKLNANTNLTFANTHFSIYSRTNTTVNANSIGVFNNVLSIYALAILGTTGIQYDAYDFSAHRLLLPNPNSLGHYIGNVLSTTSQKLYKNGSVLGSITAAQTQTSLPSLNFYLSTRNDNNVASAFDSKQLAFSTLGDGLTDTDATNLYTRVQTFQTTLARQV
jgi:hypothetical protein